MRFVTFDVVMIHSNFEPGRGDRRVITDLEKVAIHINNIESIKTAKDLTGTPVEDHTLIRMISGLVITVKGSPLQVLTRIDKPPL